jgi:hypothetical protein
MGYHGSNPKSTTSIDSVWHNWSGQSTPKKKLQKELNPKAHGFNKASRKIVK